MNKQSVLITTSAIGNETPLICCEYIFDVQNVQNMTLIKHLVFVGCLKDTE